MCSRREDVIASVSILAELSPTVSPFVFSGAHDSVQCLPFKDSFHTARSRFRTGE